MNQIVKKVEDPSFFENPIVILILALVFLIILVKGTIWFMKFLLNSTNEDKKKDSEKENSTKA